MTARPDDHVRPLLGAFVLGHLDPVDVTAVRAHLEGCAACRVETAELAAVAGLLPLADPERLGASAEPPRGMLDEVLDRIHRERGVRDRARRRSVALRLGAVAAALALVFVVGQMMVGPQEPSGGEIVALTAARPGVLGEAVLHEDPSSTWVEITTSGLVSGETYAVWFEEAGTGERSPLGTFVGVEGDLYISLYSTLPRDHVASIGVSTPDGSTVMVGRVPVAVAS
jgi:hypothetical protein